VSTGRRINARRPNDRIVIKIGAENGHGFVLALRRTTDLMIADWRAAEVALFRWDKGFPRPGSQLCSEWLDHSNLTGIIVAFWVF
jgi:hypothetical protein